MNPPIRCAVIGAGRWGRNVLRILQAHHDAEVCAVVDASSQALQQVCCQHKFTSLEPALRLSLDAVCVVTPPETHARLASQVLDAGLHVFVEKPLTTDVVSADNLAKKAVSLGCVAMVGHLLRYHPAVETMLHLIDEGRLGRLRRFYSLRCSTQGPTRDGSVVWSLGPHDVSILQALDTSGLALIQARYRAPDSEISFPRTEISLRLHSGLQATIQLARTKDMLVRHMVLSGERGTLLFDDRRTHDALTFTKSATVGSGTRAEIHSVPIAYQAPLTAELHHFLRAIREGRQPLTCFEQGAQVVHWLSLANQSLLDNAPTNQQAVLMGV